MNIRIVVFFLLLCMLFSACAPAAEVIPAPPESILYLGGAVTLHQFEVVGGPGDPERCSVILIRTPIVLEKEGFHLAVVGTTEDDEQDILFTEADIVPENYYAITEEQYSKYSSLILYLDYTWYGTLMSQRIVNLLTLEELSSVESEFRLNR